MSVFRRMLAVFAALVCLGNVSAAQQQDEFAAARALGPRWKLLSRASGMIFAGKVLEVETLPAPNQQAIPMIQLKFRVEHAVAGVQAGQLVTVREWAGAWTTHRPMRQGQRILLFLYPPSGLGLTSPVGGAMGQIALDPSGKNVVVPASVVMNSVASLQRPALRPAGGSQTISLRQLERAILNARKE